MTHPMHQIAKALAAYGRQGDTKLAHITPREEEILKSFGGVGSKNPHTGLVEYYGAGTEGSTGLGGSGVGPGAGNVGGGFGDGPSGGGRDGGRGDRNRSSTLGLPAAFTETPAGVAVGLGMPGAVGLYTGVKALAGAKDAALGALGLEGSAPAVSFDYPGDREGGEGGEREGRPRQPVFAGGVPGLDPLMRPEAMGIPGFLDLSPAQTALQQRSQIATFGTQGVGGYGSEEAQAYWKNLVSRSFLDDQGGLVSGDLLPIEQQYANQVLGLQSSGGMTEFLRMIA